MICMLSLIHNLRFDRSRVDSGFSFKKDLNNMNTSELVSNIPHNPLSNKLLSSNWLSIYRKQ